MKIAVVCDAHIFRTSNNEYWCTSVYGYSFFQRFFDVFEKVRVVARVKEKELPLGEKYLRVDGPNVEIYPVFFFQGPREFLSHIGAVISSLHGFEKNCDVVLYRMPSTTAQMAYLMTRQCSQPKGIEVVYNLHDELVDSILSKPRKIISWLNHICVRNACADRKINGVAYVTKRTLQEYYPSFSRINKPDELHFESHYSTIQYSGKYIGKPKKYKGKKHWLISHVVIHIQSKYRGHETMIRALKKVRENGFDAEIEFIGDGPMVPHFKNLADQLGVGNYVHFIGLLPSAADVNRHLREADIFVYPTHFAGLPRVLIEAMGAALPCISTPVAGIPEILDPEDLVGPDDDKALAKRLIELFNDPEYLERKSRENLEIAKQYTNEILQVKRNKFYEKLKKCVKIK